MGGSMDDQPSVSYQDICDGLNEALAKVHHVHTSVWDQAEGWANYAGKVSGALGGKSKPPIWFDRPVRRWKVIS